MATKFGRQPARDILFQQRRTIRQVASEIGVNEQHLYGAMGGRNTPSPIVRERLPELLGKPLESLFTPEVLEREFWSRAVSK